MVGSLLFYYPLRQVLAQVLANMHDKFGTDADAFYEKVHTYVLNPKAITMDELYGGIDKLTLEWHDGLMATTIRHCVQVPVPHV